MAAVQGQDGKAGPSFAPFQWVDDNKPALGEGLSRTSSRKAQLHEIQVSFAGTPPMKEYLRAVGKAQAIKFARNRYPNATSINYIQPYRGTKSS